MNNKLIALAVAAALAAPMAAAADVTIYGKMHASWDFADTNDAANDDSDDVTGALRASRIGFKGSEDLGDGLSTIWQIEQQVNNNGTVALRNTFVGLKGGWGQVRLGRHDTPYKIATGKLDIFADTAADYNNIIGANTTGSIGFDERVPQTVAYITPAFNGFTAAIARVSAKLNEGARADETEAWSMMGMYENGPMFASLAYEDQSGAAIGTGSGATAADSVDAWKLGLGYKFGSSKVGFIYEDISHNAASSAAASAFGRSAWYINFAHAFGANTFKIAYGNADDSDMRGSNDGADTWALGLDHAFSKRTSVYALYTTMDNDPGATYTANAGNAITGYGATTGNDVDVFSVGIIHKF